VRRSTLVALVVALGAAVAAARSVVIVDQAEVVYVTEFGRSVRLIDEPGLPGKWPYQSRRGFDTRLQLDAPPPREMLTRDKKNLEVAWYASWRIADYGHADLFLANDAQALVWQPLLDWLRAH
jgi:membrane protease subunit HflC